MLTSAPVRLGIGALALAFAAVATSFSDRVGATECVPPLSPCIDSDTLWPHAGPAHFQAIGGSEIVAAGQLGFALVTSYLSRPIVLHLPSPGGSGSDAHAVDD